jgi:hypothetical protein
MPLCNWLLRFALQWEGGLCRYRNWLFCLALGLRFGYRYRFGYRFGFVGFGYRYRFGFRLSGFGFGKRLLDSLRYGFGELCLVISHNRLASLP